MNARISPERLGHLDTGALQSFVDERWDDAIVPALENYIAVPAKSIAFDPDWAAHGHIDRVVRDAAAWVENQGIQGLKLEVVRLNRPDGGPRTPLIYFELPATRPDSTGTVLMYGHLDKQPEFSGWRSDLGPWNPKYENGRLYGRGGADDGYAVYATATILRALQKQGAQHPRVVGFIETSEESGSVDLLPYVDALRERLGDVSLVVCLDSGAGNYDQLWMTSSLRGLASGVLKVQILTEGVHSGEASGIVPSSLRILRMVLDRLEDSATGRLLPPIFHCEIPPDRLAQTRVAADILGAGVFNRFPWACGGDGGTALPMTSDPVEALINRTWRPTLSITGAEGLPPLKDAGAVLRPYTAFKLSLRLPPLVDAARAVQVLKNVLEDNAPYDAQVTFTPDPAAATGWNAPETAPWLETALQGASQAFFGEPCAYIGQGGTIPLMRTLQQGFPKAQMMVCGVLGPKSNAHGPNEFLHVPYAKKLTAAVAAVIATHP